MINLKALEKSLAKIEEVGRDELGFEANGVSVVFGTLRPEEEEIVDGYARLAYVLPLSEFGLDVEVMPNEILQKDEDGDDIDPLALIRHRLWLDRLRHATLGFVIVEIDGQNLRGVEYIETGEEDENGNKIAVLKHEAIRELTARWVRPVLTRMFGAYSELLDRVNIRASKMVHFKPADIEEELVRLRQRTRELERHKELQTNPELRTAVENARSSQTLAEGANTTSQNQMDMVATMSEEAQATRVPQTERLPPQQPNSPVQESAQRMVPRTQPSDEDHVVPPPFEGDSRFDPADPDAALEAENARQEILYRQAQERKRQAQETPRQPIVSAQAVRPQAGPKNAVSLQGPEQLREARNTANVVQAAPPNQHQTPVAQGTRRVGGKDIPIFRQPTTTLERRGPMPDLSKVSIDPVSRSQNPRFVGPKKSE